MDNTKFRGVVDDQEFDNYEQFQNYVATHPEAKHISFEMGQRPEATGAVVEARGTQQRAIDKHVERQMRAHGRAMAAAEKTKALTSARYTTHDAELASPVDGIAFPFIITPDDYLANNPQELWIKNLDQVVDANKIYLRKHGHYLYGITDEDLRKHGEQVNTLKENISEAIVQTDEASKSIDNKLQACQDELTELNKKRKEIQNRINEIRRKDIPYLRGKEYPLIAARRLLEIYDETFKYASGQIEEERRRRDDTLFRPLRDLKPKVPEVTHQVVNEPRRILMKPGVLYPRSGAPKPHPENPVVHNPLHAVSDYGKLDKLLAAIFQC